MQSKATTVAQYLAELPPERRQLLEAVRQVILANLDPEVEEGMQYGMIGYYVPHRVFPPGYHCDPRQPLPYGGLASQKNHCSFYLMCHYADAAERARFEKAWAQRGKKLDMGKCCIRFKKIEDLALDVLADSLRRLPVQDYIARYQASLEVNRKSKAKTAPRQTRQPPKTSRRA